MVQHLESELQQALAGLQMKRGGVVWIGTEPESPSGATKTLRPDGLLDGGLALESCDAIIHTGTLPRARDAAFMRAAGRALRPGGRIVVHTRRRSRRLRRLLHAHFEGEDRPANARYPRVRAVRSDAGGWIYTAHRRNGSASPNHFEALAPGYSDEIPDHMAEHYRRRKLRRILEPIRRGDVVLDLGCGVGAYAQEVARTTGARVIGLDSSPNSLHVAHGEQHTRPGAGYLAASTLRLPLADAAVDVVYTVNMLHHLKRGEQELALEEIHRVLKPTGRLVVCEMNLRNPFFALYMRHVFPRTRAIDRGDEEFLPDRAWPLVDGYRVERLDHHTFAPDFLPRAFYNPMRRLEAILEKSPLRRQGIHYTVTLQKTGALT